MRKKIIFLFLLFFIFFIFQGIEGEQSLNCSFPSVCRANNCYLGLPNGIECQATVSLGLSEIENFLGERTRINVDLESLNQFCKQYTKDPRAYALTASIHNYCTGCDQYLARWTGSNWEKKQACAGQLNVQAIVCASQCQNPNLKVDLKINNSDGPIELPLESRALLSWQSEDALSCQASGDWEGEKDLSGSQETVFYAIKEYLFVLKCKDRYQNELEDSLKVKVVPKKPTVITKPVVQTY
ncbi:MAG: hypothetical protein ACPLZH_01865 [Minisyncoccales bacterium]